MSRTSETMHEIKTKGYWRVLLRPNKFSQNLISTLADAKRIVEDNKVVLRGWDYPHVGRELPAASEDSIESVCNWPEGPVFEYWRYFLSGQFVHYFATREDLRIEPEDAKRINAGFRFNTEDNNFTTFLDVLSTLYTITEIYLFASRLTQGGYLGESLHLEIELNGVNGRTLFFWDTGRDLMSTYTCNFSSDKIFLSQEIDKAVIISDYASLALKDTIKLFQCFNWEGVSIRLLEDEQRKFLERRL